MTHFIPNIAATVAVATPCWPAPVSAMMRVLPMRLAKRICPIALLILCAPVWIQIFALQINFCAAEFLGEPFGKIKRRGAADKFLEVIIQFALEFRVVLRAEIFLLQFLQRMHQRLRHITSAVRTEVAVGVGQIFCGDCAHGLIFTQRRKDAKRIYLIHFAGIFGCCPNFAMERGL